MSSPDDDLDLVAISLPRPLAGAVARGLVRCINLEEFARVLPRGGLLVAIHAGPTWVPEDVSALVLPVKSFLVEDPDAPAPWPDCPPRPEQHPEGLVGVGLLYALCWAPANDPLLDQLGPHGVGPWVLGLRDVVKFKTPAPCLGYRHPFELPGQLAGKIIQAWLDRPPEDPPPSTDAWTPEAGGEAAP